MAEVGTLDIQTEIQALVSDKLQVVSYKWLSRNFTVSSNDAKKILQEFVEQNGNDLKVVYSLAGWLKNCPGTYHIQLAYGVELSEVKKKFEDSCSIQVYSVQACIPKDTAVLWNSEFVQAEELSKQPSTVENCLRDIRFCHISNSFVKRNVDETSLGAAPPQFKDAGIPMSSRSSNGLQTPGIPQPKGETLQAISKSKQSPAVAAPAIKSESNASDNVVEAHANVGKMTALSANKMKAQNVKSSSGSGGSLANMWGRASVKPKPTTPETTKDGQIPIGNVATSDAQICAREAIDAVGSEDDSDADANCVSYKRSSNSEGNRKRRVVFDLSDEDDFEDAVNLASPDPPKKYSSKSSEPNTKMKSIEKTNLNFEAPKEDQLKIKQEATAKSEPKLPPKEATTERELKLPPKEEDMTVSKDRTTGKSVKSPDPEDDCHRKVKATDEASNSTKRRRVLKTKIDERGREVTEVVWEGEETDTIGTDKKDTIGTNKKDTVKTDNKDTANTDKKDIVIEIANNRPPGAKKSPAIASNAASNPVGKAGAKKAGKGVKDAKQGNIMSFFKKV